MRYWWVNHNQTARFELSEGYLWSPRREASGARSQFYENMRRARPGEPVLSFAKGVVRYCGIVRDVCRPELKPSSFGRTGDYWSNEGWYLPVEWQRLPRPFSPRDRFNELEPLLPRKYSPINLKSGKGNQKAYLAEVSKEVFELATDRREIEQFVVGPFRDSEDPALKKHGDTLEQQIANDPGLDATTKKQLVNARRGQGKFRENVQEFEYGCRLTGLTDIQFLIASHIRPWRVCRTNDERLDGQNGLLLAPHVDFLFDRGLISFANDGSVLESDRLSESVLRCFGLSEACKRGSAPFRDRQTEYLAYHRENVFLNSE